MALVASAKSAITNLLQRLTGQRPRIWLSASLLLSLGLLAYSRSVLPGNFLGAPLALVLLYLSAALLYLRIQAERDSELKSRGARWTVVMEQALDHEKAALRAELKQRDSKWYQPFSRVLTAEDERLFCTEWSGALGVPVAASHLRYLQQRIGEIEDLCLGRLAGSVQDAILRILVARSVRGDHLRFLEIGTLFGVNAIAIYDIASCYFERVTFTAIDPLDGYYGPGNMDTNTGLPVTRDILQRNLHRLMVPPEDYQIVQGLSSSDTALDIAGQQTYNFLFIDGDHSYEGVKADFELYSPLLESGGYLVFDDYPATSWPGVQQAVDEVVCRSPLFELLGASWRSIVFRKT
jgi:predicted O-methyltransferase YrrM